MTTFVIEKRLVNFESVRREYEELNKYFLGDMYDRY